MSRESFAIEVINTTKKFPGVVALENADFQLRPGTVHGLVGKNGAGKTTLVNILSGMFPPTKGDIFFYGEKIHMDPRVAVEVGIAVVPQEPQSALSLTVAENLFLGILPVSSFGFVRWNQMEDKARQIMHRLGMSVDVNSKAAELTVADRQLISTAKAFFVQNPKVIILDEVTAALSEKEEEMLYAIIKVKKEQGVGIVFISHELKEIFRICDYVTVLRDGKVVATREVSSLNSRELVSLVVGEELEEYSRSYKAERLEDEVVLSVERLNYRDVLTDVSFKVHKGEIVGIAGLRGSARTELFKAIFGLLPKDRGKIGLKGRQIDITTPSEAMEAGIYYLPEDREGEGLFLSRSTKENLTLCATNELLNGAGFINHRQETNLATRMVEKLKVVTPSLEQQVMYLSGGNKQKVILGRGLMTKPVIFLLDEPTKGIDVETKMQIRKTIVELSEYASVLLISSEFEDLLSVCDRILVMRNGRLVKDFPIQEVTEADLHHYVGGTDNV